MTSLTCKRSTPFTCDKNVIIIGNDKTSKNLLRKFDNVSKSQCFTNVIVLAPCFLFQIAREQSLSINSTWTGTQIFVCSCYSTKFLTFRIMHIRRAFPLSKQDVHRNTWTNLLLNYYIQVCITHTRRKPILTYSNTVRTTKKIKKIN